MSRGCKKPTDRALVITDAYHDLGSSVVLTVAGRSLTCLMNDTVVVRWLLGWGVNGIVRCCPPHVRLYNNLTPLSGKSDGVICGKNNWTEGRVEASFRTHK